MKLNEKIESGFKTPDNFFENFEKDILERICEEKPVIKISFWNKNKKWMLSAAALLMVTVGFYQFYQPNNQTITSDTIAYEDIYQLTDWENELSDKEITQLYNEILIDENQTEEEIFYLENIELN